MLRILTKGSKISLEENQKNLEILLEKHKFVKSSRNLSEKLPKSCKKLSKIVF